MNQSIRELDSKVLAVGAVGLLLILVQKVSEAFSLSFTAAIFLVLSWGSLFAFTGMVLWERHRRFKPADGPKLCLGSFADMKWWQPMEEFILSVFDFRHVLVTGVTGSGKSTLIRTFIDQICMNKLGFLYIDFKGEKRELDEIHTILRRRGVLDRLQTFDLSDPKNCLSVNLLNIFPEVEETVGFVNEMIGLEHEYYRSEAEQFVRYSLYLLDAVGKERSFENLNRLLRDDRFRLAILKKEFKSEPFYLYFQQVFGKIKEESRAERFSGLLAKLSSFTEGPLKTIFNPVGKGELKLAELFEENIPTIIRIPGEAYGDVSTRIVKAFISSLPVLMARRRQETDPKKYFVFLDEQCSYTSDTTGHLLKTAGSANVSMILTRQCDGDFDSHGVGFRSKVVSACSLTFTFQVLDPETRDQLAKQSGTVKGFKWTSRVSNFGHTGESSEREVQEFRVAPNRYLDLRSGRCIVSARTKKLYFDRELQVYQPSHFFKEAA